VFHVDKPRTEDKATLVHHFSRAVANQQLLTLCDAWVLNPSGYDLWLPSPMLSCCVRV